MAEFVRHAKMSAWGLGIVLEDRAGQRTVLFADGSKRSFKGEIAAKLLVAAEPPTEEERIALERGAGSGGGLMPVNLALEAQLPGDFVDPEPFLVYADWLEQKGDPRGKLIQAQHRGSAKQERDILREHGEALIPKDVIKRGKTEFTWKLGFIASVKFGTIEDLDERLTDFFAHPSAVMTRELVLESTSFSGSPLATLAAIKPVRLARIVIGGDVWTSPLATGDLAPLGKLNLESIRASGERVMIAYPLVSASLRELTIATRRADATTIRNAVTGTMPKLDSLSIHVLDGIDDGVPSGAFANLPALTKLELRNTKRTRDWLTALSLSPARATLTELRLPESDINDAPELAKQFPKLEVIQIGFVQRELNIRMPPPITDAARAIAQPARWDELGIDVNHGRVWGVYPGTTGNYAVAIERGTDWALCSCPSAARPCKHALALHAMAAGSVPIDERMPPGNHYTLASRRRFTPAGE